MDENWRKSSRCEGGSCVETALIEGDVRVRDSQSRELAISPEAWTQFVEGVKNNEFDRSV